jgi:cell division septum initiation protein DivIVA
MLPDHLSIDSHRNGNGSNSTPGGVTINRVDAFMNLHRQLDQLEEMLLESGPRIMGRTLVNEEQLCEQIDQVRLALPESIAKAEEILDSRQQIIGEAEHYADEVVGNAKRQAQKILDESMIMRQAEQEANQLRRQTQDECEQLRRETLDEVNQMRRQAEKELDAIHQRIKAESAALERDADDYSDQSLGKLETQLIDMLKIVQNGRRELRKPGI